MNYYFFLIFYLYFLNDYYKFYCYVSRETLFSFRSINVISLLIVIIFTKIIFILNLYNI